MSRGKVEKMENNCAKFIKLIKNLAEWMLKMLNAC